MSKRETLNWSSVFDCLANDERRAILSFLVDEDGQVTIDDVAGHLAVDGDDDTAVGRARVQLHHVHLPKLNAAGLIVWSRDQGTVRETTLAYQLPVGAITTAPVTTAQGTETQQVSD
ncbi:hypothetical protein BVU17_08625 [Haloarcula taiwanensis]|uniref:DUF7344 domain-containing protein n=1 Tax=Haloarcula taiwanensis TaxID=1932004 RepID=A0A2H4ZYS7_9EURY|nr:MULTISPECIES: hypothetical protein [Haloarcula]AUG47577.1 hypothetical protein BVU17_08625 [Haloarcula taiwanensis]RLM95774.1 hypothetical protein D3D01_10365 [Haloarcula sp. Atlit-7R]